MFERTGRLDDMPTEVTVCVPTAAASFFHRSLLTPINVLHMTGVAAAGSHRPGVCFYILPLLKSVLSAVILAEFHINCFALVTSVANYCKSVHFNSAHSSCHAASLRWKVE